MAADPLVVVSGAVTAALTAVLGYFGSSRGKKAEASIALTDQVREWATQLQESEEKCREELSQLRVELAQVRLELDAVKRTVRDFGGEPT